MSEDENGFAQIYSEADSASEASNSSSSSSSGSSSSDSNAQIGAESEDEDEYGLAQINADIEAEAFAAEQEEAVEMLTNFLSQIGIDENEQFLAQLGEVMSDDQLKMMAMDPSIYMGLAQLASDYHSSRNEAVENILAQVGAEGEEDMDEINELLAQLDVKELEELYTELAQTE